MKNSILGMLSSCPTIAIEQIKHSPARRDDLGISSGSH